MYLLPGDGCQPVLRCGTTSAQMRAGMLGAQTPASRRRPHFDLVLAAHRRPRSGYASVWLAKPAASSEKTAGRAESSSASETARIRRRLRPRPLSLAAVSTDLLSLTPAARPQHRRRNILQPTRTSG